MAAPEKQYNWTSQTSFQPVVRPQHSNFIMKVDESEAYQSIKTSIEAHRTDVLKAVIDTVKKGKMIRFKYFNLCD